jgi:hypothetical protein
MYRQSSVAQSRPVVARMSRDTRATCRYSISARGRAWIPLRILGHTLRRGSGRYRDRNQDSVRRIPRNGPTVSPQPASDSTRTHATAGFMNAMILPERNEHALPVHSSGRAFAGDDHAIIPLSTRLLDRFSPHATRESPLPPSRPPKRRQSRWQRTWYRALSCRIEGSRVSGCRTNRRRPQ